MAVPCDKHCEGKCRVLPKHRGSQGMLPGRGDVKTENWRHRQRVVHSSEAGTQALGVDRDLWMPAGEKEGTADRRLFF